MASLDKGLKIHLVGRSRTDVEAVAATLNGSGANISTRVISNGHTDPLHDLTTLPDVLILVLSDSWQEELGALAGRPAVLRPPTVVIGHRDDTQALRMAMRAGALDFLTQPIVPGELNQALQRIIRERFRTPESARNRIIAVLNAKGGSGASLIAGNLAHIMAAKEGKKTALLDCDLQFGAQALSLDLHPTYDVTVVLQAIDDLDEHALQGYMAKHRSGLHLLAAPTDRLVLFEEISPHSLSRLLNLIGQTYSRVIIDLPRLLDAVSTVALEQADFVVVVMQQTLVAVQDAKRLTGVLQTELEIPRERIVVVVNRYHPKHPIKVGDVLQTLQQRTLVLIPNDYLRVEASASQGIPLYEAAPTAPITKALVQLAFQLGGEMMLPPKRGVFSRAKAWFSGKPV
jgi:pilus assembly protein CpaE